MANVESHHSHSTNERVVRADGKHRNNHTIGYDKITLPIEWQVRPLSSVASIKTGPFGSSLHESDYVEDGTPIITVEHLSERGIVHRGLPLVSDEDRSRLAAYELRTNDIVFSRVGSIDRSSLVSESEDGWLFSGRLLRVRTSVNTHAPYLNYHFADELFKRQIRSVAVGQTMASLNTRIMGDVSVILPPLSEQRTIAAVLSDMDSLIDALDTLTVKKQAVKKATMQRLLTGKTRLPEFSGEWKIKTLREIAEINTEILPSDTPLDFTFNYISLEQVDTGNLTGYTETEFRLAPSRARRVLRYDDVLMSTVRPNLKAHLHYRRQIPNAICSTGFAVIRAKHGMSDPGFIFAHLFGEIVNKQVEQILVGSNYPAITSDDVGSIRIPCPPDMPEQRVVATVLSDMDAEIAALQERRDKTIALKRGMMQELLTGNTRLPEAKK